MTYQKVITIDGPAGSGKSTTAKEVARRLGWKYIDTGAMYRALGLAVLNAGGKPIVEEDVAPVLARVTVELDTSIPVRVYLNGEEVTDRIRTPEASSAASEVSVHPFVRRKMVDLQRQMGLTHPSVLEGRDTGTVVFPDAGLKIYLDADLQERAHRRLLDYEAQGRSLDLEEVVEDLRTRDDRDKNRADSPLRAAEDSVTLDTTGLTIEQQIDRVVELAMERFAQ